MYRTTLLLSTVLSYPMSVMATVEPPPIVKEAHNTFEESCRKFLEYRRLSQRPADIFLENQGTFKQLGVYQHYKGDYYHVFGSVQHSETEEKLVLYQAMYGDFKLWARPVSMFFEKIEFKGEHRERFQFFGPLPTEQ